MLLVVGGMIGLGKSSVATILGEHFGTEVFFESVDDNKVLPLFYTASEEEIQSNRYPFLLQLWFLDTRFKSIKQALVDNNNILDRSIYEDWYFAQKNKELGRISELEFEIYENLLNNMMEELKELLKEGGTPVFTTYAVEIGDALWSTLHSYLEVNFPSTVEEGCYACSEYYIDSIWEE